jgi:hypothetical protein
MNEKFTTGPWKAIHVGSHTKIIDSTAAEIAKIEHDMGALNKRPQSVVYGLTPERLANVLLIEASPSLYTAAKQALLECPELMGTPAGDALDKALKQARGEHG